MNMLSDLDCTTICRNADKILRAKKSTISVVLNPYHSPKYHLFYVTWPIPCQIWITMRVKLLPLKFCSKQFYRPVAFQLLRSKTNGILTFYTVSNLNRYKNCYQYPKSLFHRTFSKPCRTWVVTSSKSVPFRALHRPCRKKYNMYSIIYEIKFN